jgi:hypothetical protein
MLCGTICQVIWYIMCFKTRWAYHGHIFAVNWPMKNSWGGIGLEDWSVSSFFWHIWMLEDQHINCLTSNWTSITCGTCTHDSCSISQIVTSWTLALIGTQRAWSTKWFVDGPVPLYEMAGCETGYHGSNAWKGSWLATFLHTVQTGRNFHSTLSVWLLASQSQGCLTWNLQI